MSTDIYMKRAIEKFEAMKGLEPGTTIRIRNGDGEFHFTYKGTDDKGEMRIVKGPFEEY